MIESLKTAQNVKSLPEDLSCSNFQCKTVPFYNVSWLMTHMLGKLIKSSFTPNKRLIVSTSEKGEMVILLKTAQKPRRRAGIEDHLVNDSPVALPPSNMDTLVHTYLGGLLLV